MGGVFGFGVEIVCQLVQVGVCVFILDVNMEVVQVLVDELCCYVVCCDIIDSVLVIVVFDVVQEVNGVLCIFINCVGIGGVKCMVGKDGSLMLLEDFSCIVNVNLIGIFNVICLIVVCMVVVELLVEGECGVIVVIVLVVVFDG